ncbi:sensor histidine kinase [Actinomadura rudentiformis]|uniref:histidine kinase n=1 Tax=Actinomadura rudentiformis TaxID=359158 RepID=A0A6H9Y8J4_9ACTN|nr:sensor histidine kinase [Actinomadura rudentiformis]KAB2339498.1 sensor histidine kinase [Actinomadura rudentiformis]
MVIVRRLRPEVVDGLLAAVFAGGALAATLQWPEDRPLDAGGALLLIALHAPLAWRRRWPGAVLLAFTALVLPFHVIGYQHHAVVPAEVLALVTYAFLGRRVRAVLTTVCVILTICAVTFAMRAGGSSFLEQIGALEAIIAVIIGIQAWRVQRSRMAAILERAETAERTREEEALRRVAEERLRIARDLHDLLAHTITVIGVQAGAAAHQVAGDRPLDRAELAGTLNSIAATCRDARAEVRATLQILRRTDAPGVPGELAAGLDGVGELVNAARAAGLDACLVDLGEGEPAPEVGIVAHRIVQEALTNVIKHAGARTVEVRLVRTETELTLSVTDDGRGPGESTGERPGEGFGIVGMTERARSVGGTVETGRGADGGFAVTATLPMSLPDTEPVTPSGASRLP